MIFSNDVKAIQWGKNTSTNIAGKTGYPFAKE